MDIPVNPDLPKNFEQCDNGLRPPSHAVWWYRPFIISYDIDHPDFPEGKRYFVRCLDGGAWDRSTNHGLFYTLESALQAARNLSESYADRRVED